MSLDNLRAVTLDLYGTLLDVESSVLAAFAEFLAARGYTGDPGEVVRSWGSGYFQETMIDTLLDHGRTPFEQISRSVLGQTLAALGVEYTREDLEQLLAARDRGTLFPDVLEGLSALRGRYTLAVLSNGDRASLERATRNLALPVDRIISAEQAGVYKPHPGVYRIATEQLGLEGSHILHVAAHGWDIRGARAFGLRGAYINRAGIHYGDSQFQPDLEAPDMIDLAAQLP